MSAAVLEDVEDFTAPRLGRAHFAALELERSGQGLIYGLCDPETGEVRYVGQTSDLMSNRYAGHLSTARTGHKQYSSRWIRTVLRRGLTPTVLPLDMVPVSDLDEAEVRWIKDLRRMGCRLTNANDGGGSMRGYKASAETREKMSRSMTLHFADPAARARLSAVATSVPPVRRGEDNNKAKLTVALVIELRQRAKNDETLPELAAGLTVTPQAVWYAITGRTWKQVDAMESPVTSRPRQKLSDEDVLTIRTLIADGQRNTDIAGRFNVDPAHISDIRNNRKRTNVVGDPGASKEVVISR